jgi:hypothetical protein
MAALRKVLVAERFFELADEYGSIVLDVPDWTLTITAGDQSKTVKLLYLGHWERANDPRMAEANRAVRVFELIQSWIAEPDKNDIERRAAGSAVDHPG